MSFSDHTQFAACYRALCGRVGLAHYSTPRGPTEAALVLRGRDPLSHGESIFVRTAWAFWNGEGTLQFAKMLETLNADHAGALCAPVIASQQGGTAVEAWLRVYGAPPQLRAVHP